MNRNCSNCCLPARCLWQVQGRVIADLPGHYLAWFARQAFHRDNGQLLALMHELDHNNLVGLLEPFAKTRCPACVGG